jgi:rhodanese-related sulfurtransferase
MSSLISEIPAANATDACAHFSDRLRFETDCADVFQSQQAGQVDYVLVDVRSSAAFGAAHVPGALNIPTSTITAERLTAFAADTLFVVYCAGPHCNGVHRAALRIARLGYAVKEMIGGVTGWLDEGLPLTGAEAAPRPSHGVVSCAC